MASTGEVSSKELVDAQSHLWNHIFAFINSLSLKCALELGIPDAIQNYGKPVPITELAKILSIPERRVPNFRRFMRLLAHNDFFNQTSADPNADDVYELNTNSTLLVKEQGASLTPFVELMLDESLLDPWQKLSSWFQSEEPSTAFEMRHGMFIWEATGKLPGFGKLLRDGLGSDSASIAKVIVEDCSELFRGAKTLVEVAGGTGTIALAIKNAFPEVECTVLDLPHMINAMEKSDKVKYLAGDMFEYIPPADMLILKVRSCIF